MTTQTMDLPNLNFGLTVKNLHCVIQPTITPNILDHYLRKPEDQEIVVGTLLGTIDGSQIDIHSSFTVPQYYDREQKQLVIDSEYMQKMMKFHRKVNPKEGLLGMYISSKNLDEHGLANVAYFSEFFQNEKKRALIPFPLIMMVDPSLQENKLSITVSKPCSPSHPSIDIKFGQWLFEEESYLLRMQVLIRPRQHPEDGPGRSVLRLRALRYPGYPI